MIVGSAVLSVLRAILILLRGAVCWVVVFGGENVVSSAAASLGWYSGVTTILTWHRLRSRAAMRGSIGRVADGWSHSAGVSVSRVREGLELHSLAGVHFLAESKKVEGGVRADLILHASVG